MNRSVSWMCTLSESSRENIFRLSQHTNPRFNYHKNSTIVEMNDAKLIDLVEAQPSIYDKTDVFYSNKEHVRSIWQMIASEMQQEVPVCQKRWRYLRDYFVRQLHISENKAVTLNDVGEKQMTMFSGKRSYWPLYDRLSFLKPFSSTRRRMKRASVDEVISQTQINSKDEINSTASICSEGSDHTGVSSSTTVSGNYTATDAISNLDYLKFYQAMQMAAQQNINLNSSSSNGYDDSNVPLQCDKTRQKRKRNHSECTSVFQQVDYAIDEHDCFFKSLLSSVRRISDEHVIAFRTEILQVLMKFRSLSEATDNDVKDLDDDSNDYSNSDDVVVVNTEEAHWRKNLFRKQF